MDYDLDDDPEEWLYRGVPEDSQQAEDARACGEIEPPAPSRLGECWRMQHVAGDTETGYTSWTTDRSIAMEKAFSKNAGRPVLLRIRRCDVDQSKLFEGRADEFEWLIAGTVSGIEVDPDED